MDEFPFPLLTEEDGLPQEGKDFSKEESSEVGQVLDANGSGRRVRRVRFNREFEIRTVGRVTRRNAVLDIRCTPWGKMYEFLPFSREGNIRWYHQILPKGLIPTGVSLFVDQKETQAQWGVLSERGFVPSRVLELIDHPAMEDLNTDLAQWDPRFDYFPYGYEPVREIDIATLLQEREDVKRLLDPSWNLPAPPPPGVYFRTAQGHGGMIEDLFTSPKVPLGRKPTFYEDAHEIVGGTHVAQRFVGFSHKVWLMGHYDNGHEIEMRSYLFFAEKETQIRVGEAELGVLQGAFRIGVHRERENDHHRSA